MSWLNGLPEVHAVPAAHFGGKAITEQNLSDWRKTGYPDWQRQQERRELLREPVEEAEELSADDAGGAEMSRRLAAVLGAELAMAIRDRLRDTTEPEERWKLLVEAMSQLTRLRREDHKAASWPSSRNVGTRRRVKLRD